MRGCLDIYLSQSTFPRKPDRSVRRVSTTGENLLYSSGRIDTKILGILPSGSEVIFDIVVWRISRDSNTIIIHTCAAYFGGSNLLSGCYIQLQTPLQIVSGGDLLLTTPNLKLSLTKSQAHYIKSPQTRKQ